MKSKFTPLVAALIGCGALCGTAAAQSMPELKFSGFGTVAAVHSSEDKADFVGSRFQPNGVGYTNEWSLAPDSKLAGQVNAVFNNQFSAVVQLVSQHNSDNSWTPKIEWANVKFQATPELGLRLGRIALPVFQLSESRFVGYGMPWVRPPVEVYFTSPITSSDGADATYRSQFGSVNNSLQVYYGSSKVKLPANGEVESNPGWGINDSVEFGSFSLRAGYNSLNVTLDSAGLTQLVGGFTTLGNSLAQVPLPSFQASSAQALAAASTYSPKDIKLSMIVLGATYDPGDWFVMSEAIDIKGEGLLANKTAWYLSGGYRFGSVTPYVTYASVKGHANVEAPVSLTGSPAADAGIGALNAGLMSTVKSIAYNQDTVSVGARWDLARNLSLKGQYDRMSLGDNGSGSLTNVQPGFVPGGKVDVFTVSLDFVF